MRDYTITILSGSGLAISINWQEIIYDSISAFIVGAAGAIGGLVVGFIYRRYIKNSEDE